MLILDGHVHVSPGEPDPVALLGRMEQAEISGGVLISLPPDCFGNPARPAPAQERLENLVAWTQNREGLYPFFWIDPMEADALDQVAQALGSGVAGFKVISSRHYPGDPHAMRVYAAIADAGRPILFHSGILWDGKPSSHYCRPAGFESLLEVPRLRFALAHIGWPWCDELIAVYGKFRMAPRMRPDLSVEMFIDLTPGTPGVYRREALAKLFGVGYDVADNVIFGTDCSAPDYKVDWARGWIERDRDIYRSLGVGEAVQQRIFGGNLKRFVGA